MMTSQTPSRLQWTPELVEQFWDGFSKTRLVELGFSKLAGKAMIAALAHLLTEDIRILDFGAGDGDLIELMCQRGLRVAGYEPSRGRSQNMLVRLSKYPGFLGTINADSGEQFDVVMVVEVVEHILEEQLDKFLELLAHFVRPGGILIITTPNNEDLELNMAYCPVSNTLFHRWQHVRSFTRETLVALISNYDFEEIATHQLEFRDDLFLPYGEVDCAPAETALPTYMQELRANRPAYAGAGTNLVYVGRKTTRSFKGD